jgi:hypothetical protein
MQAKSLYGESLYGNNPGNGRESWNRIGPH